MGEGSDASGDQRRRTAAGEPGELPHAPRPTPHGPRCDGAALLGALEAAGALLERQADAINALNVFPVPDGDTGKNMLLTMQAALEAARAPGEPGAGALAALVARGALMGSRGNSGVILSQILRGFARGLDGATDFDGPLLAATLREAAATAYRAVQQPV